MSIRRTMAVGGMVTAGLLSAASGVQAQFTIDGAVPLLRTPFNGYPDSTLTFTDNIDTTGTLSFIEGPFGTVDLDASFFANRHNAWLSSDGGSTAHAFNNQDDFSISFDLNLDATPSTPRKEAGFVFVHPTTGTGQFIVTSDNGEIASFSSFFPFTSNLVDDDDGKEYGGTPYVGGTNVHIQTIYRHGVGSEEGSDLVKPASLEFVVNGITAGVQYLGNLENGLIDGTQVALYVQSQVAPVDSNSSTVDTTYSNFQGGSLIPGDLNADGFVGLDDLDIILGAWNETQVPIGETPTFLSDLRADPNNDNFVGLDDLDIILNHWNEGTPPSAAAIPEPASLALLGLGGLSVLRRRP